MSRSPGGSVSRSIQTLFDVGSVVGMTDGQLIDRFLERKPDVAEAAFAALVQIHGPMVWSVCRSTLADRHDAEDAFQSTFLVLVRKASSVRRRDTLGPWLHGVARRVAVRSKGNVERRRRRESANGVEDAASSASTGGSREEVEILHQEIDRLPEKYREVVVLCDLEGRTQAEVARLLGCPIGTVGVRVSRARELIRSRLTRRGVGLPAAVAGAMFIPSSASAATVPPALATSTVKVALGVAAGQSLAAGSVSAAVLQLAHGVSRTMTITKLTFAASCLMAAGLATSGIGWVAMDRGIADITVAAQDEPAQSKQRVEAAQALSANNLRRIGIAMNQFAIASKEFRFPDSAIRDQGKPLLSWRVALLPYLGRKDLYDRFHHTEPWDSPHNKTLLKEMPDVYAPTVDRAIPRSSTYYQVFVGKGSMFEGDQGMRVAAILDGVSNIIMVVEAATPVPWTKPEDLTFDEDKPLPELGGQFVEGFHAAMADGSVFFLKKEIDPKILRALITRAGGEQISRDALPFVRNIGATKGDRTKLEAVAQLQGDAHPEGWGGGGEGYSLLRDPDIRHGGKASGLIESKGQAPNGFGTFTQGIRATAFRGKRIRLSAHAKSSRLTGKAGLWMRIDGKTKSPLGFDNMMNRPIKGTTDWTRYDVVLDVPEDAENIFFGFLMAGQGRAWVDDLAIETVGKDVETTDRKLQATNQASNPGLVLPDEPVNLGFEK